MRNEIKVPLYAVCLIGACLFGLLARSAYRQTENAAPSSTDGTGDSGNVKPDELQKRASGYGNVITYGGAFFVSVLGLSLLLGRDISQHFGNRVLRELYNDEGEGVNDPDYEIAEQAWANGQYLEAISLMREYLKKNPREQHAALRIAEIYEKDLRNPLAAALEYEEVLKHKLTPDRWGWSAIHLCNLYTKLNHEDKMVALLRRIDAEYPETPAAEKARRRLEDLGLAVQETESDSSSTGSTSEPSPSGPKLPPGFTLRKS